MVKSKKAALELSISTIVIIVLALTMLILGIVLVRSIMCSAIGLTDEVDKKARGEIDKLFGSIGGEVNCIGSTGSPVKMVPGQTNIVYCGIKADFSAKYTVVVTDISSTGIGKSEINSMLITDSWDGTVAPNDETPKKVARIKIEKNAPETDLYIQVTIKREGEVIATQDLDFRISRQGFIQSAIC